MSERRTAGNTRREFRRKKKNSQKRGTGTIDHGDRRKIKKSMCSGIY
jgi:hypothetical protein